MICPETAEPTGLPLKFEIEREFFNLVSNLAKLFRVREAHFRVDLADKFVTISRGEIRLNKSAFSSHDGIVAPYSHHN